MKLHVWAGISCQGKTPVVIFEGIMNAAGFIEGLEAGLVPYNNINRYIHFMQDNNPKHTSNRFGQWLEHNIHWWHTPAESPDLRICGTNSKNISDVL